MKKKFGGHSLDNIQEVSKKDTEELTQIPVSQLNTQYLEDVAKVVEAIQQTQQKQEENIRLLSEESERLQNQIEQFKNIKVPNTQLDEKSVKLIENIPVNIQAKFDNSSTVFLSLFQVKSENLLSNLEKFLQKYLTNNNSKVISYINDSVKEIDRTKSWLNRKFWILAVALVWAILASVGVVYQYSSSHSEISTLSQKLDSIKIEYKILDLERDYMHDYIHDSKKTKKNFNAWLKRNRFLYERRLNYLIPLRDSVRKKEE